MAAGVTTVLTGPGSGNLIGGQWVCLKTALQPSVEQMVLLEPAGMKMALGENPKRVYGEQKKAPSTRMGNAAKLRAALVDAQNYLEKLRRYEADLAEYQTKVEVEDEGCRLAEEPNLPERDLKLEALGAGSPPPRAAPRDEGPHPRPPGRRYAHRHPHCRGRFITCT